MTTTFQNTSLDERELVRTARITGLLYLGSMVAAVFGHFIVPAQIFEPGNAAATLSHLAEREMLARFGIAMELASLTFQALVSLWFYKMFRSVDIFLAVALLALGMVNAIAILGSTAALATALDVARNPSLGGSAATAQLMYILSGNLWVVVTVFFGLWLIPMGLLVLRSGWMPRPLGWLLNIGGVGYTLYAFIQILAPEAAPIASVLVLPTLSEFWMMGYLLVKGVRRSAL